MKMRRTWNRLKNALCGVYVTCSSVFQRTYVANKCGHKTKLVGWTKAFEERYWLGMPKVENGKPDHCLECIGKMAIRCAWCGRTIYISDDVTLCYANQHTRPDATRYHKDDQKVVGCRLCAEFRSFDCCASWMPPGCAESYPSHIDLLDAAVQGGECPVIIGKY